MIDFSEITLVKAPNDNFVGIRKSKLGNNYEFWLPNGFNDFPEGDFDKVRDLFFKMYRTFRKFENDNKPNRVNINRPDYQTDQDQTHISSGGLSLQNEQGEPCQIYSKLKMIERVLDTYDDLAINSIQKKIKRTEDIDYSQIHKYLDRAIYLDNDVVYVETMDLPRPMLRYESTDIVNLYCYILDEIIQQLQEDVPANIKAKIQDISFLAKHFKDDYLTSFQSIFDKDTFLETTSILKESLENIDKNTYYKDTDYWGLYEAIETFLYGELNPELNDGDYWGIKGFSLIWEDMCQTYFFRNYKKQICYADTDIPLKDYSNPHPKREQEDRNRVGNLPITISDGTNFWMQWIYSEESDKSNDDRILRWHELLVVEFNPSSRHLVFKDKAQLHQDYDYLKYGYVPDYKQAKLMSKSLRPDLVLKDNNCQIEIIDYKDVPLEFYFNPSNLSPKEHNKYRHDVIKQLTYELAIQQTHPVSRNIFFIPYYYESAPVNNHLGQIETSLDIKGIRVFKANFFLIQDEYLQENT
ncbi:LlaJI family restriction endonuclease [Fischerella thermalis]|uniref:LlaJI family restriction endonuclease n=1 Tax=Fischerella thermalis TaxID=372787 RepID=UPI00307E941F